MYSIYWFHKWNTQEDNAKDIDVVKPIYNLIEYNDNYLKTSAILCQCCRDELAINDANDEIVDFNVANAITNSFKRKPKISAETGNNGKKVVYVTVLLKYLCNFGKPWNSIN